MATPAVLAIKRLHSEVDSLQRLAQEQEKTIMDLRSELSVERAMKKPTKKEQEHG